MHTSLDEYLVKASKEGAETLTALSGRGWRESRLTTPFRDIPSLGALGLLRTNYRLPEFVYCPVCGMYPAAISGLQGRSFDRFMRTRKQPQSKSPQVATQNPAPAV